MHGRAGVVAKPTTGSHATDGSLSRILSRSSFYSWPRCQPPPAPVSRLEGTPLRYALRVTHCKDSMNRMHSVRGVTHAVADARLGVLKSKATPLANASGAVSLSGPTDSNALRVRDAARPSHWARGWRLQARPARAPTEYTSPMRRLTRRR